MLTIAEAGIYRPLWESGGESAGSPAHDLSQGQPPATWPCMSGAWPMLARAARDDEELLIS